MNIPLLNSFLVLFAAMDLSGKHLCLQSLPTEAMPLAEAVRRRWTEIRLARPDGSAILVKTADISANQVTILVPGTGDGCGLGVWPRWMQTIFGGGITITLDFRYGPNGRAPFAITEGETLLALVRELQANGFKVRVVGSSLGTGPIMDVLADLHVPVILESPVRALVPTLQTLNRSLPYTPGAVARDMYLQLGKLLGKVEAHDLVELLAKWSNVDQRTLLTRLAARTQKWDAALTAAAASTAIVTDATDPIVVQDGLHDVEERGVIVKRLPIKHAAGLVDLPAYDAYLRDLLNQLEACMAKREVDSPRAESRQAISESERTDHNPVKRDARH